MSKVFQKAIAKLNNIIKTIEQEVPKKTEEIAVLGHQTAQATLGLATLDNLTFTQKHRTELVNYIDLWKIKDNEYQISAGINAPDEVKYELYYAEYGAGLGALPNSPPSPYIPKGRVIKDGKWQGYWWYTKLFPQEQGFTNTSVAIEYMKFSKETSRLELKKANTDLAKKIRKAFRGT